MRFFLTACFLILTVSIPAQNSKYWKPVQESSIQPRGKRQIIPTKYLTYTLLESHLKDQLNLAPTEKTTHLRASTCIIELPLPNGHIQKFKVVESPIMSDELAAAYPHIKTYSVKGVDDVYASGKIDWNDFGFHASIYSAEGDFYIDPYDAANTVDYISYYTRDFLKEPQYRIPESDALEMEEHKKEQQGQHKTSARTNSTVPVCIGDQLRSYRLAIACTGEYAIAATGTTVPSVAQTLSKIVTTVNRVDGVFEKEVAVRMVLVATETNVIFTDPSTDPFTGNNNANTLISESQTVITNTIGASNFDIGHTFSTGGGGLAFLGVVCTNSSKARGITGSGNPVGDPYDIDYVAHEIGHQFDGNHTFNSVTGSCGGGNRSAATAVEPGSGVTIMGYAGICTVNDLASNSIAYFHAISYDEIVEFTQNGSGNTCALTTTSGNQAPLVNGAGSYIIPISTPFVLVGSGIDPDSDPITFSWEETDAGTSGGNWNSGSKPFFRSYAPVSSATRYFPKTQAVINGNYTGVMGEYLPDTPQTLNFRITARDNMMGGGGVCYSSDVVSLVNAGPLTVTYPNNTGIAWGLTQNKTITWAVNGTDLNPINCFSVTILISFNSGATYSVLKSNTPNDGSETIPVPTVSATINTCRIKIESAGNIFYDISNNDFTISTDVTAGLEQVSTSDPFSLRVWPNPLQSRVFVSATSLIPSRVSVVKLQDVLGNVLYTSSYENHTELNESIDLSFLSSGVYFLSVENDLKRSLHKIIKD